MTKFTAQRNRSFKYSRKVFGQHKMQYVPGNRAPVAHRLSLKIVQTADLTDSVNRFRQHVDHQHQTSQLSDV